MTIGDQSDSDSILPCRNRMSVDVGAPSPRSIQMDEQVNPGEEYAPKIRKPYTISKQRERWSEEEHKKFLEALKLHGRAWRRIEEHVGTKTAVQIRSHAQKFFSKVVRESSNGDASSVKSIEIPPPRPKRKPMHPYPRKMATPLKSGTLASEKLNRSGSPDLCLSEPENQSPTSVLSTLGSDAFGTVDSTKPSEQSSPVSSAVAENSGDLVLSEAFDFAVEESRSSPARAYATSNPANQACVKLELFPEDNDFAKEGSDEASSTQCLKLFGKTVLVTDAHMPPTDETLTRSSFPAKYLPWDSECPQSTFSIVPPTPSYYFPTPNGSPGPNQSGVATHLPWGSSCAVPCTQVHSPIPMKGRPLFNDRDLEGKGTQKEGSSTGSNAESVDAEYLEIEAQSSPNVVEELVRVRASIPSLFERRANSTKRVKGFVPYKRCLAERGVSSSTLTGEEREEQRTRLCL
ncbi:hypothetical protein EJD97_018356 [Solanum chilense]|uniref:Uncharacterized protein n=2 Tax=Solanum chilense TaxID=4083 RepID=A0A6N2B3U0_SOLCI|nr:hypothetical protein EJD97_018356 [Solanum chilense]